MNLYNLALWLTWDPLDLHRSEVLPVLADNVEAEDPYNALCIVMTALKLKRVGHAAVQCPDGFIVRHDNLKLSELEAVDATMEATVG